MIAACCVKAAQTVNRMRALVDEGSDSNGIFGNEKLYKDPKPNYDDEELDYNMIVFTLIGHGQEALKRH